MDMGYERETCHNGPAAKRQVLRGGCARKTGPRFMIVNCVVCVVSDACHNTGMKKIAPFLLVAMFALIPTSVNAQSAAELQVQIQTLLTQIQQLQQQISAAAGGGAVVPTASPVSRAGCPLVWRSLK